MQKLNLNNIPICDQIWDEMPPSERGRICQKCQTEIIDFRKMSDLEIAYEHSVGVGRVCGIYPVEKEIKYEYGFSKAFLAAILGILTTSTNIQGQNVNMKIPTIQLDKTSGVIKESDFSTIIEKQYPVVIHGRIIDNKGEMMSGLSVFVLNTRNGTIVDENGKFTLVLNPEYLEKESLDLVFSLIGIGRFVKSYTMKELCENIQVNQLEVIVQAFNIPDIQVESFGVRSSAGLSRWTYVFMCIFLNRFCSNRRKKHSNSLAIASIFAEELGKIYQKDI